MIVTTFDYWINDSEMVLIKASCTDVENWASDLKVEFPKDFRPDRSTADDIEEKAVAKLLEEKNRK